MVNENYITEIKMFENAFLRYKKKRIVLYGIGRHTASLLPAIKNFQIVGLLDRDSENIGKLVYGVPVITEREAEEKADIIIIYTAEAYWETIYSRIKYLNIPIFYRNGQRAHNRDCEFGCQQNTYWKSSYEELVAIAKHYNIVSFDIFDTLLMRKVYSPTDIFRLMDLKLKLGGNSFSSIRSSAAAYFQGREYGLDELYESMRKLGKWSNDRMEEIKRLELDMEEDSIIPRSTIIDLLLELQYLGKEIYLISDMYLPKQFIMAILQKYNVKVSPENILLSGDIGLSKRDGGLWKYYSKEVVKHRSAFHIGDNLQSDIENSKKEGINSFYIMNASEMLRNSSLRELETYITGIYESTVIGMLCAKLFENPFRLNAKKGNLDYNDFRILGYCWFGNVILTYLLWMQLECEELGVEQIIFLARDGYFLIDDYNYLIKQTDIDNELCPIYLPISRRLVMVAAIVDENTFHEAMVFPYIGKWKDYLYDRFDITILPEDEHENELINASADEGKIKLWLIPYHEILKTVIKNERNNYLKLLGNKGISSRAGIVDVGYYGNTQHYLNKLLGKELSGFYFSADLSIDNKCTKHNRMYACFQSVNDEKANSSNIHKQSLVLESFLTAPYGMIKKVDVSGNCIYEPNKNSQERFQDRVEINEGVKAFIKDYCELLHGIDWRTVKVNPFFADRLYGFLIKQRGELSQNIKDSFYWDNGLVQRRESKIFE